MDSNSNAPSGFWSSDIEEVIARQYPIHKACRDGDVVTLSRLVAVATPDQILAEDLFYGWSPLHWAAYFGKSECLNGLLSTGVNVNIRTSRFQQTPAHISAFGGHPSCLCQLVKAGADLHAKDFLGEIPLHKAARVGNIECLRTLIANGVAANLSNNNGCTAGDLSRHQNFEECAHLLELACNQLPASDRPHLETNGFHHVESGSSGAHVANGNGHTTNGHAANGISTSLNGTNDRGINRKRCCHDESNPVYKRPRVAGGDLIVNGSHNGNFHNGSSVSSTNDTNLSQEADMMTEESADSSVESHSKQIGVVFTAPTPANSQEKPDMISAEKYVKSLQGIPQYEDELFYNGSFPGYSASTSRANILTNLGSHYC